MKIEVDDEQLTHLVSQTLSVWLDDLDHPVGIPRFSYEPKIENHYTKKLRKALKIVIAYSSVGGDVMGVIDGK